VMFWLCGLCRHMLSLVLVCMALLGLGIGTLVIAFQVITEATMSVFAVTPLRLVE